MFARGYALAGYRDAREGAFTRIELAMVVATMVVLVAAALLVVGRSRTESLRRKDEEQVLSLQRALVTFYQSGPDSYALPSIYDKSNATVAEIGAEKNTTANIWSMLVFSGTIKPEQLVSPAETNRNVVPCKDYEYDQPHGSPDPPMAIWDPKLSATLDGSRQGNVSYAHMQPCEGRRAKWSNTFVSTEPSCGTRGPEIVASGLAGDGGVIPKFVTPGSNTLRFFGTGGAWSGIIAFNDCHVEYLEQRLVSGCPFVGWSKYKDSSRKERPDLWFYDEPDDPDGKNDFLGIFLKAGEKRTDFRAAWD